MTVSNKPRAPGRAICRPHPGRTTIHCCHPATTTVITNSAVSGIAPREGRSSVPGFSRPKSGDDRARNRGSSCRIFSRIPAGVRGFFTGSNPGVAPPATFPQPSGLGGCRATERRRTNNQRQDFGRTHRTRKQKLETLARGTRNPGISVYSFRRMKTIAVANQKGAWGGWGNDDCRMTIVG